jgi:hypothetical protein
MSSVLTPDDGQSPKTFFLTRAKISLEEITIVFDII